MQHTQHIHQQDGTVSEVPYLPTQEFLNGIAIMIQNLRQLSIHVVEQIVLWRDQLRQMFVITTKAN